MHGGIYSKVSQKRRIASEIQDNNSSGNNIGINPEDMMKMNRTSVRLNKGSGNYIATPEVSELYNSISTASSTDSAQTYHQLHYLWYIFTFTHPEAYTIEPHHGISVIAHVDHCIDSL